MDLFVRHGHRPKLVDLPSLIILKLVQIDMNVSMACQGFRTHRELTRLEQNITIATTWKEITEPARIDRDLTEAICEQPGDEGSVDFSLSNRAIHNLDLT
ncbi:hypothetical protein AUF78_08370 [archaeon 13_1_20CM_2_51_12]|nr:MAG: hypothetical protein AUF78_08370 [archaeon 13_1_20CM_2_51_12]